MELIKIEQSENGNKTVLASDLYNFLQPKTKFIDWVKRMLSYGYIENEDYYIINIGNSLLLKNEKQTKKRTRGGHNMKDYQLTIECAKSIAMVQRSEMGKKIRNYFIEVERHYKEIATPKQITELKNRLKAVEQNQINYVNDWSVDRFLRVNGIYKSLTVVQRQQLGKSCTKEYKRLTGNPPKKVQHPSYVNGQNVYPYELINKVFRTKYTNQ